MFKPFRMKDIEKWFEKRPMARVPEFGTDHSCYPYYAAFLGQSDAEKVKSCHTGSVLTSGQAKRINRKCGFPKNHKKNLWYCPSCVREDIAKHGETCWRRLPQMPGAACCPIHRERLRESGVSYTGINYQLMPATYALIHIPDPVQERGTIYTEQYIHLTRDIEWLLENGFSVQDGDWLARSFFDETGKSVTAHLLYTVAGSTYRENRFEDYLVTRMMKELERERIEGPAIRQISTILSIEKEFGSIEKFCSV